MFDLTAAVIGSGFIGPVHVEGLTRAGVTVAGMLGSSPEKSKRACEALGLPQAYESLDQLLNDSDVDVVHVTSPNRFHFDQVSKILAAGKHVLCEKPLAMNSEESNELVRIAAESGLAAGVNYNIRYYPLCLDAASRARQGELGDLFHVTGCYAQDWLFHPSDFNWRVSQKEGGALRAVADIGTHWLDLVQNITDQKVIRVNADLSTVYRQRTRPVGGVETFSGKVTETQPTESIDVDTEDFGAVMLHFQSGAKGVMWVSQVAAGRKNHLRFDIAGSKQAISWCSERPNETWVGQRDHPNQSLVRDPSLMASSAANHCSYPGGHNEGFGDTFKQLFLDFYRQIESHQYRDNPTFPTFKDGHYEIMICEAILKSHQQRTWIEVEGAE